MRNIFMKKISKNKKSKGQSLVEYGLILALVSVVAITVLQTMGGQIKVTVNNLTTKLQQANQLSQSAGAT
ncbi:MAG TPA: Flp family type IVb pilin [Cyanobacteria bacterium UBA9971]|nr:Flp family type IVb pilin [Cyanobacteria bacterium UBA9971]